MSATSRPSVDEFYANKSIFITGGSGMAGKCLITRLLDTTNPSTIYVLLRGKRGVNFEERFKSFLQDEAFDGVCNKEEKLKKLVALEGDISLPRLGLTDEDYETLTNNTQVVFHSAATVRWNENLRTAININVSGTQEVLSLCRAMSKLAVLVHVSSYACWMEKDILEETIYSSALDAKDLIGDANTLSDQDMDELAKKYIGPKSPKACNTYMFTKTMAEVLVQTTARDLNVVVARLPLLAPAARSPAPGWVESIQINNAILVATASGFVQSSPKSASSPWLVLPVDFCCNALITTAWDIATKGSRTLSVPSVYNIAPTEKQSLNLYEISAVGQELGTRYPSIKQVLPPKLYSCDTDGMFMFRVKQGILLVYAYLLQFLMLITTGKSVKLAKTVKAVTASMKACCFELHKSNYICDLNNLNNLYSETGPLSASEREKFYFEPNGVNYRYLYQEMYFNFRRNVLKESDSNLDEARARMSRIKSYGNMVKYATIAIATAISFVVLGF